MMQAYLNFFVLVRVFARLCVLDSRWRAATPTLRFALGGSTVAVQAGIIKPEAAEAGVQAFTWTGRAGQVWVTVLNGVILNAGVNPLGALR